METEGKLKPWLLVTWLTSVRTKMKTWSLWVSRDLVISLSPVPDRCVQRPARDFCPREDETHKKRLSSLDSAGRGRCWTTQHLFKWLPTPRLQAVSPRSGETPPRLPFKGKQTHHLSRWYLGQEALWGKLSGLPPPSTCVLPAMPPSLGVASHLMAGKLHNMNLEKPEGKGGWEKIPVLSPNRSHFNMLSPPLSI